MSIKYYKATIGEESR